MFGMGMPEILLILAIALIVIGPKKLPDLAKSLGRALIEFKRATNELKSSLEVDTDVIDVKKTFKDMDQELKKPIDVTPAKIRSEAAAAKKAPLTADDPPAPGAPAQTREEDLNPDSPAPGPPSEDHHDAGETLKEKPTKKGAAEDGA